MERLAINIPSFAVPYLASQHSRLPLCVSYVSAP